MKDTFFIFGGRIGVQKSTRTINAFSTITNEWKKVGEMTSDRDRPGVVVQRSKFLIVGNKVPIDQCALIDSDSLDCVAIDQMAPKDFGNDPKLMPVPANYCNSSQV